jgi:ABC-type Zn2+ transport system substrate-binding protein/surface adhesin
MPLLKRIEKRISRKEKEDELGITDLKRKMKEMKEGGGDDNDSGSDSDSNSDSDDSDSSEDDSEDDGHDSLSDEGGSPRVISSWASLNVAFQILRVTMMKMKSRMAQILPTAMYQEKILKRKVG